MTRPLTSALRVLVIDDDLDTVELLIGVLAGAGHETLGALTGGDALRVLEAESPDLVLLDLGMPGIGGLEVLRRLRMVRPDIPVIIVSGQADADLVRSTLARGAIDYLPKPVNPDHLVQVTAAALARRAW